jgi:hypothetical protein
MMYRVQVPNNLDEYRGSRRPYHTVVKLYPEQALLNHYSQWCKERVGANGWNYYGMYQKVPYEFRFKREEDLLAFKLTFGL